MKTARELGLIPQGRLERGRAMPLPTSRAFRSATGRCGGGPLHRGHGDPPACRRCLPREAAGGGGGHQRLRQIGGADAGGRTRHDRDADPAHQHLSALPPAPKRWSAAPSPPIRRSGERPRRSMRWSASAMTAASATFRRLAVRPADAEAALDAARTGPVEQGAVGAGSGMTASDSRPASARPRGACGSASATSRSHAGPCQFSARRRPRPADGRRPDPRRRRSRARLCHRRHGDRSSLGRSPIAAGRAACRRGPCPARCLLGPWQRRCRPLFHHRRPGGP